VRAEPFKIKLNQWHLTPISTRFGYKHVRLSVPSTPTFRL